MKFRQERGKKLQVQVNVTDAGQDWVLNSGQRNDLKPKGISFYVYFHGHLGRATGLYGNKEGTREKCPATKGQFKSKDESRLGYLGTAPLRDCNPIAKPRTSRHQRVPVVFDDCQARKTWEVYGNASLFGGIKSIIGRAVVIKKDWWKEIACCVIGVADPERGLDPKDVKPYRENEPIKY